MFIKPTTIIQVWTRAVSAGEREEVLALYHANATLMPTFSDRLLRNSEEIGGYFDGVFKNQSLKVSVEEDTLLIEELSPDIYCMSGIYDWQFGHASGFKNVRARYTFIVALKFSAPIVHQHSSQIPQKSADIFVR